MMSPKPGIPSPSFRFGRRVLAVVTIGVSSTAAALFAAGVIDPWTTKADVEYVDANYLGAGATIAAAPVLAGSGSDETNTLEVRVLLPAGAGSLSEDTRYVGTVEKRAATPARVVLTLADDAWQPASSVSEGTLAVETWDRAALEGKLFGYSLNALPEGTPAP